MEDDKVGKYFREKHMDDYAFIHLTPDFIQKIGLDFLKNVPVPIKKELIGGFATDQPIKMENFVMAMVMTIGMDPKFKYTSVYLAFLKHVNSNIFGAVMNVGVEFANDTNYEMAAIHFRAANVINPKILAPLYNYMLACKQLYEGSEDTEFVTTFKSEVNSTLLKITSEHPDFPMGFYYLGFSYINAGQYKNAEEAWTSFMNKSAPEGESDAENDRFKEERKEIAERLEQLKDPVIIEAGYKDVISGNVEEGMEVLEGYINTKYMDWWPLLYYLGVGYSRTERYEQAIVMFKSVLEKNASSPETYAELMNAYRKIGDEVNAEKYENKLNFVSGKKL